MQPTLFASRCLASLRVPRTPKQAVNQSRNWLLPESRAGLDQFGRFNRFNRFNRFAGFTLVELLVVIAIIGVLASLALPAYNTYAVKSRFAEVVTATNPTKTAIAACAATGDCVSSGAINLGSSAATDLVVSNTITSANTSLAAIYATAYADIIHGGGTAADAASVAQSFVSLQQQVAPATYAVASTRDGYACLMSTTDYANGVQCGSVQATVVATNQYMTAATNPYYSTAVVGTGGAATLQLPCVGNTPGTGCNPSTKYAASVSYASNGVITATATSSLGLNAETFTLTPSYSSGRVDWLASGSCKTRGGGALC